MFPFPPLDTRLWHPAAAFDRSLPGRRPYFAQKAWGACLASHIYGLPEHVHAHVRIAPEGLLLHADCGRCSQRHEVLVDFRSLHESDAGSDTIEVDLYAFGPERARWVQLGLWQDGLREWAEAHEGCRQRRGAPSLEGRLGLVVEELRGTAAAELRLAGEASPVVVVLPEAGAPAWFDASGARRAERMLTAFRVREVLRWWQGPPAAVLALEEVPAREGATVLRLALLTPAATWTAYAVVDRFGQPRPGPGVLKPLAWSPIHEAAIWLDGLLSQRQCFPVPRTLAPMED